MRKSETVTIQAEGRDQGKVFILNEMSASYAESWGIRALLALGKSGVELPDDVRENGLAGIAVLGLGALLKANYHDIAPLLQEMMDCIQIVPDASRPMVKRPVMDDDIEEVQTRLFLRMQLFTLTTGFSLPVVGSNLNPAAAG